MPRGSPKWTSGPIWAWAASDDPLFPSIHASSVPLLSQKLRTWAQEGSDPGWMDEGSSTAQRPPTAQGSSTVQGPWTVQRSRGPQMIGYAEPVHMPCRSLPLPRSHDP